MYEREERYSKTTSPDGTTDETRITKTRYGSGVTEFCTAIAAITLGVITVTLIANTRFATPQSPSNNYIIRNN